MAINIFRLLTALTILFLLRIDPVKVEAQSRIEVINPVTKYSFGEWISFEADLPPTISVKRAQLIIKVKGLVSPIVTNAEIEGGDHLFFLYDIKQLGNIRAFSEINYQFNLILESGEQILSSDYSFVYVDNRYDWQEYDLGGLFVVRWYGEDFNFGKSVMDTALKSIQNTEKFINLPANEIINIYIYNNAVAFRSAVNLSGMAWVAGHADPDINVIIILIPSSSEQILEIERQVPHEITHLRMYQMYPEQYDNIPEWLNEGIASLTEIYPNPDYDLILDTNASQATLLNFDQLCESFPLDAANAGLAYAQSVSFVRYLHSTYGLAGINDLVSSYANGQSCQGGILTVLGSNLSQLERMWRNTRFNQNPLITIARDILPWMILLVLLLLGPSILIIVNWRNIKKV